jgi:hypothetical protein
MNSNRSILIIVPVRTFILIILSQFLGSCLAAQDLIITSSNDSINARITKENKSSLYFDFMKDGELRSTLLMRTQIVKYQKGYYDIPEVLKDIKKPTDYKGERWRMSTEAGFGYRLGKIEQDLDPVFRDYLKGLRSGFHWGASTHYFISEQIALGVKVNTFQSSGSSNQIQTTFPDGGVEQGVSDDLQIFYVGPSVLTRLLSNNERNAFIAVLGLGYIDYSNSQQFGNRPVELSAGSFGLTTELGYDIGLSKKISLGISTTGILGSVNTLKVNDNGTTQTINLKENDSKSESLTAYNLSIGLRIYL